MSNTCKNIGCNHPAHLGEDFCFHCLYPNTLRKPAEIEEALDQLASGQSAEDYLKRAGETMNQRGQEYDSEDNRERSMGKVVAMFNILTGHEVSETDGWRFMQILKMVRGQGKFHEDSLIDGVAYAALAAESCRPSESSHHHH